MFRPLEKYINSRILILMMNGTTVRGELQGFDHHLNVFLAKGELENSKTRMLLGDMVLRGASILAVAIETSESL